MANGLNRCGITLLASMVLLSAGVAQESKPTRKPVPATKADPNAAVNAAKRKGAPKLVDLNKASKQELMKLPRITGAYADAIIAGRPYQSKFTLLTRSILPQDVFTAVRMRIEARQPATQP